MIEVEIHAPIYNEESQQIEWESLALVRAADGEIKVFGDESIVQRGPVMSPALGRSVHMLDDPEEWTRSLPHAYRGGDLVAQLLRDDDTPRDQGERPEICEPNIPDPAAAGV